MEIQVKFSDGTFTSIPNVKWHPEASTIAGDVQAGLWVGMSAIRKHIDQVNRFREEISMDKPVADAIEYVNGIEFASAPFTVYADYDEDEPWRHFGLVVRSVPYGGNDEFWNVH